MAKLDGWGIRFDLYSTTNDSAVTDIVAAAGESVMGVLFEIPDAALAVMDKIEGVKTEGTGNYGRAHVKVRLVPDGDAVTAVTYVGTDEGRERLNSRPGIQQTVRPTYFEHLLAGTRQFNFPAEYVAYLRQQARLA